MGSRELFVERNTSLRRFGRTAERWPSWRRMPSGPSSATLANSDAKALTRYLGALGLEVGPDRLNDLLVLLAVIMVEVGGGLSLAIGMALSGPPGSATAAPAPIPSVVSVRAEQRHQARGTRRSFAPTN